MLQNKEANRWLSPFGAKKYVVVMYGDSNVDDDMLKYLLTDAMKASNIPGVRVTEWDEPLINDLISQFLSFDGNKTRGIRSSCYAIPYWTDPSES